MGLGIAAVQNYLELYNLSYLKNSKSICDIGSQELHLKKAMKKMKIFCESLQ